LDTRGSAPPREHDLPAEIVAQINTMVARHADERVFFGGTGFPHLAPPDFDRVVDGPTDALLRK